eukprot:scaffold92070_cov22-Tisochrysis_lutea.AAC.1
MSLCTACCTWLHSSSTTSLPLPGHAPVRERETHHPMPLPHPQQLMHGGVPPPNAYYQRAGQAMHAGGMMGPPDGSKRARTGMWLAVALISLNPKLLAMIWLGWRCVGG